MSGYKLPSSLGGFRIHLVGIKGTGMAALAELLCARGAVVTGSDVQDVFYTDRVLERAGIRPSVFSAGNITDGIGCVVRSSAYNAATNCELAEAARRGIPCLLYSQALGQLSAHAYSCGIAGVHGKTTTTGLAGTIIRALGLPAQVLAGSVITSFGGEDGEGSCTLSAGDKYFVAETCEYQRHFMDFRPQKIVLTSVESDHQDFYPAYADIRGAFVDYVRLLPEGGELIYCRDDRGACEVADIVSAERADLVLTQYGTMAEGGFRVELGGVSGGRQLFSLAGFPTREFSLSVPGRHLVLNAAAAVALAVSLLRHEEADSCAPALPGEEAARRISLALESFRGGKRRSELVGEARGVVFLDDYAHHPTAIRTTLEGYRAFYPGRKLVVDFMSHTYTRTAALLGEFASSFAAADEVVLHKIYGSAREDASAAGVTGRTLFERTRSLHGNVRYFDEVMDSYGELLSELERGDPDFPGGTVFVTMGAGDNWRLARALLAGLSEKGT